MVLVVQIQQAMQTLLLAFKLDLQTLQVLIILLLVQLLVKQIQKVIITP
jgi:hypothetical protein